MPALFRIAGARPHDPAVAAWLDGQSTQLGAFARTWVECMRACGPDVRECMHDGFATMCVEDAPFAYVGVFRNHVNVGFFHGASLSDPDALLEGNGKTMRHAKLKPDVPVNHVALAALIGEAYRDIQMRVRVLD